MLFDVVPLLVLGLTYLGLILYSLSGDRSVLLDIIMHSTLVMFAALVMYFVLRS
jgi:hypothetical protein